LDFGSLVSQHGYWLLALGCFLEGETVLLLAGLAARSGYLSPVGVLAVASASTGSAARRAPRCCSASPGSQAVQRRCRPASVATMRG